MMNRVEFFVPFRYIKRPMYTKLIDRMFESKAQYVSKGRYAIIHILHSYGIISGKVGISSYMCSSVNDTLEENGYEVAYYDINLIDLNPSVSDVQALILEENPDAIVIASMYGNPVDLISLEKICADNNVIMIDDAAQSFGASIESRFVGSFGDGGFFSFPPR